MTTLEIGKKLVELCSNGQNQVVTETLYSPDIVSVEAAALPGMAQEVRGVEGVAAKGKWWSENHTVHSAKHEGPYPHGNRFIVRFTYDVTNKPSNQRFQLDEMGLFTVENDKIVREEYFYATPG
jgi:SnoaL-like domain